MPLTELQVRNAKPAERAYKLSDGEGLFLLVQPNGSKLWRMKYRFAGKEKLLSFGAYPALGIAAARQKRCSSRELLKRGNEPAVPRSLSECGPTAVDRFADVQGLAPRVSTEKNVSGLAAGTCRPLPSEIVLNYRPIRDIRRAAPAPRSEQCWTRGPCLKPERIACMRILVTSLALVAASAALAPPVGAHETAAPKAGASALEPEARGAAAVVDAFHAALAKGDLSGAKALLAEDALIYESGGVERGKAEYASHHLPADAAFTAATTRSVTRRTGHAAGSMAWVATESKVTGSFKERAVDSVSIETMILRREQAAWRIAHIHWSSANTKK